MKYIRIIKICLLSFIFFLFTSCDCFQEVQGVVIDYESRSPIEGVMVNLIDKYALVSFYTDSIGSFKYFSMRASLFGCPKVHLSFEKEGYKKVTKKYKYCCTDNAIVVLKQKKKKKHIR